MAGQHGMASLRKIAVSALLSGGLALAGLGVAAGTAHADGPYHWCPGDPKNMPYVPNGEIDWDWSICHTWYPAAGSDLPSAVPADRLRVPVEH